MYVQRKGKIIRFSTQVADPKRHSLVSIHAPGAYKSGLIPIPTGYFDLMVRASQIKRAKKEAEAIASKQSLILGRGYTSFLVTLLS